MSPVAKCPSPTHCCTAGRGVFAQSDQQTVLPRALGVPQCRGDTQWLVEGTPSVGLGLGEFSEVSHGQYNDLFLPVGLTVVKKQ